MKNSHQPVFKQMVFMVRPACSIDDVPTHIQRLYKMIDHVSEYGYLEFWSCSKEGSREMVFYPIFDSAEVEPAMPSAFVRKGTDGEALINYLEEIWGLENEEFYRWFVI